MLILTMSILTMPFSNDCDSEYSNVCITSPASVEILQKVEPSDPHDFDGDFDGRLRNMITCFLFAEVLINLLI